MIKNISCINSEFVIINYIFNNFEHSEKILDILNEDDFFFEFTKEKFKKKEKFFFSNFVEKNIFSILKNLIEKSNKRKILKIIFNISFDILNNEKIEEKIFEKIKKILNFKIKKKIFFNTNYLELLKKYLIEENKLLFSGFKDLDLLINGFQEGDLIIIAGRPSIGKTSFAINIIKNLLLLNKKIIIFSLEMSTLQIFIRIISLLTEIDQNNFKNNSFDENDFKKISFLMKNINFDNLIIKDCSFLSTNEIENYLNFFLKTNDKIDLILIDYIQLMKSEFVLGNRVLELSEISRSLKLIAKNYKCILFVLSQLNRLVEYRIEKLPILSDLKDSGSIEQDADIVIFLSKNKNKNINISIAKNRNGPLGEIELKFKNEYTKFY